MRKVFITASVINPDTEEEFTGWVDLNWSQFQLHENKEDVQPQEYDPEFDGTIENFVEGLIGAIDSEEDGTYYAQDHRINHDTGETWIYAAHVEDSE